MNPQPEVEAVVAQDRFRPVDLAREHGLSAQAVRNYEQASILPPSVRGEQGYRRYTSRHAQALRTFLALRPGHGHRIAAEMMRAANRGDQDAALRLIDQSHAELLRDHDTLDEVAAALGELTATAPAASAESTLTIGALAHRISLRPATLRKWERAGILRPHRDPATGYRIYPPGVVRDAHLAHQLRRGGHPLSRIAEVVARIRDAGGKEPLQEALRDQRGRLRHRSRAMLDGAAELGVYLRPAEDRSAHARIPEND